MSGSNRDRAILNLDVNLFSEYIDWRSQPGKLIVKKKWRRCGFEVGDSIGVISEGYWVVSLCQSITGVEGRTILVSLHRLIFFLFNGWLPRMVDHYDEDKLNNHPDNLKASCGFRNRLNKVFREVPRVSFHSRHHRFAANATVGKTLNGPARDTRAEAERDYFELLLPQIEARIKQEEEIDEQIKRSQMEGHDLTDFQQAVIDIVHGYDRHNPLPTIINLWYIFRKQETDNASHAQDPRSTHPRPFAIPGVDYRCGGTGALQGPLPYPSDHYLAPNRGDHRK